MTGQPILDTPRLTLRPLRAADREAVIGVFADPRTSRYLVRDMSDRVNAAAAFDGWLAAGGVDGMGTWAVELGGAVIGVARVARSNRLPGGLVEMGWFVAPAHTGHGYGGEAVRALAGYARDALRVPAVWAVVHEHNEPSVGLAERLGFLDVGAFHLWSEPARLYVLLAEPRPVEPLGTTLRTDRLTIRPLAEDDRAAARDIFADAATIRYLSAALGGPGQIDAIIDRRLAFRGPAGMGHWTFVADDTVVGLGHLRPSGELPGGVAEIGWYLGRAHSGRGLATEAARALLDHGVHTLGLPAVWALVHEENTASHRLADRLGFHRVATGHHYGGPHRVHVHVAPFRTPS